MNTATKVVVALIVILVIAAGAYYLLSGTPVSNPGTAMDESIPAATDSIDDFGAAMEAELAASAAALKALDADTDASAAEVKAAADTSTLYDPNNI